MLVSRLRGLIDRVIAKKIEDPGLDLDRSEVIRLVTKLVELDGMDA